MTTDVAATATEPVNGANPTGTAVAPEPGTSAPEPENGGPPAAPGAAAPGGGLLVIERILRDRDGIWRQILAERDLPRLIGRMFANTAAALACYGAVLGASSSVVQAVTSAVKLPLLFLLTLVICLPTLYLFNLVFGARLSIMQALSLVLTTLTVTATLSLAFAPISLFFLVTAPDYEFLKLLNVAIMALTGLVGIRFLIDGMHRLNRLTKAAPTAEPAAGAVPAEQPIKSGLLYVWALLFGFVGTQLAWTLRPFFGSPSMKYELLRKIDGNFYIDIARTLESLF